MSSHEHVIAALLAVAVMVASLTIGGSPEGATGSGRAAPVAEASGR